MIRIGTSSWSDPGFVEDWYPPKLPAAARLGWYAQHFDYVEVNSSFYAIPVQKVVQRWVDQTPQNFLFDVKLHRLLSRHSAAPNTLPPELRRDLRLNPRGNVILTPSIEAAVAERIHQELAPLRDAGKLGALLLQLSPGFSPRRHRLEELESLIEIFHHDSLAVELRNRDWLTGPTREQTLAFFHDKRLPLVMVDAPESEHFTVMPAENLVTTPTLAYLRLHGRNEAGYIKGKSVATRFDYDYSANELEEIANRVQDLAVRTTDVHVAFNNNRSSYAPKAALGLKQLLAESHS